MDCGRPGILCEPQAGDPAAEPEAGGGKGLLGASSAVKREVDQQPDPAAGCLLLEPVEVLGGPVPRIPRHRLSLGRGVRPELERAEHEGVDMKRREVIEAVRYTAQVAEAVAIGVLKAEGVETIEEQVLPPRVGGDVVPCPAAVGELLRGQRSDGKRSRAKQDGRNDGRPEQGDAPKAARQSCEDDLHRPGVVPPVSS